MNTLFERIIIIGYGKIARDVLNYVYINHEKYTYRLEFIEHEVRPLSAFEQICKEKNIPYLKLEAKTELTDYFDTIQENALIISAYNTYLFSKSLVDKKNITIINFHNALLPKYRGRNAPSWVIYMGEKETGITWHYVTAGIDEGDIIIQKHCPIGEDTKAYELTGQLVSLAYDAFIEAFDDILNGYRGVKQDFSPNGKMYFSKEVPAGGYFNLEASTDYIYRLLRSVDYGRVNIFPKLQTNYKGEKVEISKYCIEEKVEKKKEGKYLYLPFNKSKILKLEYRTL